MFVAFMFFVVMAAVVYDKVVSNPMSYNAGVDY